MTIPNFLSTLHDKCEILPPRKKKIDNTNCYTQQKRDIHKRFRDPDLHRPTAAIAYIYFPAIFSISKHKSYKIRPTSEHAVL